MDDVTEWWDDATDVATYTSADFEGRSSAIAMWDPGHFYRNVCDDIGDTVDCSRHYVVDLCVRLYLAHVSERHDGWVHENFDQTRLIPPRGWLEANVSELPTVDLDLSTCGDPSNHRDNVDSQYNPGTAPTVIEMVNAVRGRFDDVPEKQSDVAKRAITYLSDGYEDGNPLLHTRV